MNKNLKIFIISFCVIVAIALALLGTAVGLNWKYISASIKGQPLYTQEEFDAELEERNKDLLLENERNKLAYENCKIKLDETNTKLTVVFEENQANKAQITDYQNQIKDKDDLIAQKDQSILDLQTEVTVKENELVNKLARITELEGLLNTSETGNAQLQEEKTRLETEVENQRAEIAAKVSQIETLQSEKETLTSEKTALEEDKANLETLVAQKDAQILQLQNEVTRLTGLIAGYEDIKNGTFEVDFYIEYPQTVLFDTKVVRNGNSVADLATPQDTDEYRFDGWSLDRVNAVDPSTVSITENTTFYALVTPKYKVEFIVGDETNTQNCLKNEVLNFPSNPTKQGCRFLGWSTDGENVIDDTTNFVVSSDTTFIALFSKLTFTEKTWNGLTNFYGTRIWTDGNEIFYSYGPDNQYVLDVETSTWTPVSWSDASYLYGCILTDGTTYYSFYQGYFYRVYPTERRCETTITSFKGLTKLVSFDFVWSDGVDTYYSSSTGQYVLDFATRTWSVMNWKGLSSFSGSSVMHLGEDIYCSDGSSNLYILDVESHTWNLVSWDIPSDITSSVNLCWTDGVDYYYSWKDVQYVYDTEDKTFKVMSWDNFVPPAAGARFWTDGVDYYYSWGDTQYVLTFSVV